MLKNSNRYLACHPRMWLRDERSAKDLSEPGVFPSTETAVSAASEERLGCCLHHESGRLTIDSCILQCWANPLYLSLISTGGGNGGASASVSQTRIEGGAKAVLTSGDLAFMIVFLIPKLMVIVFPRVIYARNSVYFWLDVDSQGLIILSLSVP
uniref:Uncharacterized protein n=1 Tax=Populus trichocarpa TaxID=3694 RepID=U5GJV3_POPTR